MLFALLASLGTSINVRAQENIDLPPVIIDYFYEPGCPDCLKVRDAILPELEQRFEGFIRLVKHDIGIASNVIMLATVQAQLGITKNEPVCMVVDYQYVFNGFAAIKTGLFSQIDECVAERMEPGWKAPLPISPQAPAKGAMTIVEDRAKSFTLPAVIIGGLTDGFNPCAIGTLVFFMSLLAVSRVKGSGLLQMGISFCLATFLTYTAIGFGLLRVLHLFTGFPMIRFSVEIAMVVLLGIFAFFSFRDAYRYKVTGNAEQVTLRLPRSVTLKIHAIMHAGLRARSLVFGGLFIGAIVTALESVCTGQVYIPILVLIIKEGQGTARACSYLLIYNAMFVLPLIAVFTLTYFGLKTETLLTWSKKNVIPSKLLLGSFFLAMAILIGVLR